MKGRWKEVKERKKNLSTEMVTLQNLCIHKKNAETSHHKQTLANKSPEVRGKGKSVALHAIKT
jgi:hypothetical protein